jgi:hypothetical protein
MTCAITDAIPWVVATGAFLFVMQVLEEKGII